jgi:Flp pilus assembly pilin Flp
MRAKDQSVNPAPTFFKGALGKQEQGVTMVEHAMMLALSAIAVALVQAAVVAVFGQVITAINSLLCNPLQAKSGH